MAGGDSEPLYGEKGEQFNKGVMKGLEIFRSEKFGNVRTTLTENNEPIFCLSDVCNSLEIQNHRNVKSRLKQKGVFSMDTLTKGGHQKMLFIDESNLYKLVFQSRKKEAEEFTEWVTSEVIPAIRKHGVYLTPEKLVEVLSDPDTIIKLATDLKKERQEKERLKIESDLKQEVIEKQAPKVEYHDKVLQSHTSYTTTLIAKELGLSATALNRKLRELGIQYKQSGVWVLYAKYQDKGYTDTQTYTFTDQYGEERTAMQTVWTESGRKFIHGLLRKDDAA